MPLTPKLRKGLGRIRDTWDPREPPPLTSISHLGVSAPLPAKVDVFAHADPPVRDQKDLGACSAFALCTFREWLALQFPQYSSPFQVLSPLFAYYQERKADGDIAQDGGSMLRTSCRVVTSIGICPETEDPYDPSQFASSVANDSSQAIQLAVQFKAGAYHRIPDVATIKSVLASNYPALLGFTVYPSFEEIGSDGIMPMPVREKDIGGHAVCIRGYDDSINGGSFFIRNSWGEDWGLDGNFYMPYAFLENYDLSQWDSAVAHLGPKWRQQ
jgi:C1A family cysteine protease